MHATIFPAEIRTGNLRNVIHCVISVFAEYVEVDTTDSVTSDIADPGTRQWSIVKVAISAQGEVTGFTRRRGLTMSTEAIYVRGRQPPEALRRLLKKAKREILDYCQGNLKTFSVPFSLRGITGGIAKTLRVLTLIPYGECASYGEIARRIQCHPRAVGVYCARNPLPILVPCHRVIRSNGYIGGFLGSSDNQIKAALLAMERGCEVTG